MMTRPIYAFEHVAGLTQWRSSWSRNFRGHAAQDPARQRRKALPFTPIEPSRPRVRACSRRSTSSVAGSFELAQWVSCRWPFALMADWGGGGIKVDHPQGCDGYRGLVLQEPVIGGQPLRRGPSATRIAWPSISSGRRPRPRSSSSRERPRSPHQLPAVGARPARLTSTRCGRSTSA